MPLLSCNGLAIPFFVVAFIAFLQFVEVVEDYRFRHYFMHRVACKLAVNSQQWWIVWIAVTKNRPMHTHGFTNGISTFLAG